MRRWRPKARYGFFVTCLLIFAPFCSTHAQRQEGRGDHNPSPSSQTSKVVGITAADVIETPRILKLATRDQGLVFSSDRRRYVLPLVRGDLKRNGNWLDLIVGSLPSGTDAPRPRLVASLFTTSGSSLDRTSPIYPYRNKIVWLADNRRIALEWTDGAHPNEVIAVDTVTGRIRTLTHHQTGIFTFSISGDGRTIVYSAPRKVDKAADRSALIAGFAVPTIEYLDIDNGDYLGQEPQQPNTFQVFAQRAGHVREANFFGPAGALSELEISPDGRYVLGKEVRVLSPPADWAKYQSQPLRIALARIKGQDLAKDPSRSSIFQMAIYDFGVNRSRRLIDAPDGIRSRYVFENAIWSPDATHVLVGPTFLPFAISSKVGVAGEAIADVDVSSGKIDEIRLPEGLSGYVPTNWSPDGSVTLTRRGSTLQIRKAGNKWLPADQSIARPRAEIRETANSPPVLVLVSANDRPVRTLEIDPKLAFHELGRAEIVNWIDQSGGGWQGRLYYPPLYEKGNRYPLVIQTHGTPPDQEFTLLGKGDESGTGYAAQPLVSHGIIVLQMSDPPAAVVGSPNEPRTAVAGIESAVRYLSSRGLINAGRVGLLGFSRSAWYVQYAISHSSFTYAAAIADDGINASYIEGMLHPSWLADTSSGVGAPPFGHGLAAWLENSVGFNADRIRTPLRIEWDNSAGPWMEWEIYSRMRQLNLPVEYVAAPEHMIADHPLQIPSQCLFSEQGTVDWFDFWLNDHEDPDPKKADQYRRWKQLRMLRDAALTKPRPPLLRWTATPVANSR